MKISTALAVVLLLFDIGIDPMGLPTLPTDLLKGLSTYVLGETAANV
jgi:hypothetical protein